MKTTGTLDRAARVALAVVIAGYLAVTVAESILAPLFPSVTEELGIDLGMVGVAFGALTGSIAVGNLAGGWTLARFGPKPALLASLALAAVGAAVAALAADARAFVLAQTAIGAGTGIFFAPGIHLIGRVTPANRRGMAMGIFGVAFSGGLAIAALLAAVGATTGWRVAFWVAAATCAAGAVMAVLAPLPEHVPSSQSGRRLEPALVVPVTVGSVGTVSQYGTVGFMAIFAVSAWGLTPAAAALMIAVSRVLSVAGKLVVGYSSDRWGAARTLTTLAICLGATGIVWTVLPGPAVAIPAAVVYAAAVSGLFPISNLLAYRDFGDRGGMLGIYRSAHIGVGALGAWLIGAAATDVGLGTTLKVSAALPIVLVLLARKVAPVAT